MAISGSPAIAYEIARMLEMSVQYYRRSQLQKLSLDGKLRTLSRLLLQNLPMAMQGVGAVYRFMRHLTNAMSWAKSFFTTYSGPRLRALIFAPRGRDRPSFAVRFTT